MLTPTITVSARSVTMITIAFAAIAIASVIAISIALPVTVGFVVSVGPRTSGFSRFDRFRLWPAVLSARDERTRHDRAARE